MPSRAYSSNPNPSPNPKTLTQTVTLTLTNPNPNPNPNPNQPWCSSRDHRSSIPLEYKPPLELFCSSNFLSEAAFGGHQAEALARRLFFTKVPIFGSLNMKLITYDNFTNLESLIYDTRM